MIPPTILITIECLELESGLFTCEVKKVNRNSEKDASIDAPPTKRVKIDDRSKHYYPPITESEDNDQSNERNFELLREEFAKTKTRNDMLKHLMASIYHLGIKLFKFSLVSYWYYIGNVSFKKVHLRKLCYR